MKLSPPNHGQRVAQAVGDFERRRTHHGRGWVAVFLNEATVVIAVHGPLTGSERALAATPAGRAQVSATQRRLFASAVLLPTIERIYGVSVLDTTVEMEPTTGGAVLLFTTNTAGRDFPPCPGRPAKTRTPRRGSLERSDGGLRRADKPTGRVVRV